jgi:hypothetical protein
VRSKSDLQRTAGRAWIYQRIGTSEETLALGSPVFSGEARPRGQAPYAARRLKAQDNEGTFYGGEGD